MYTDTVEYFIRLVSIDSESRDERAIADVLIADLKELGAEVVEDCCYNSTSGNTGNIFARIPGTIAVEPILLCAHIDTVVPGRGIKPRIVDGRVCSDGTTVLGADDKSGVAEIICGISRVVASGVPHGPIEVLLTVSEEIGLLGSKCFDKSLLKSAYGYAFDAQNIGDLVLGAPSQNSISITIHGKEAHAGVEPEKGINAIRVAAEAIAAMPNGRIDHETTCNMGLISGGMATNIVPNRVEIKGEARSHNPQKLTQVCDDIRKAVDAAVAKYQGSVHQAKAEYHQETEYQAFRVADDAPVVTIARKALEKIGVTANTYVGGGGSDANIISAGGVPMIICGTGMMRYHTVEEYIEVKDLINGTAFVEQLLLLHAGA